MFRRRSAAVKPILQEECPICMDNLCVESRHVLPCGHAFHKACIFQWMEKEPMYVHYTAYNDIPMEGKCPLCRRPQQDIIVGKWNKPCVVQ